MLASGQAEQHRSFAFLAQQLTAAGLIDETAARQARRAAIQKGQSFVAILVADRAVNAATLARTLSDLYKIPLLDLQTVDMKQAPVHIASEKLIRQHSVLPVFFRHQMLVLAVADPTNQQALDEFRFHTGHQVSPVLVAQDQLEQAIEACFNPLDNALAELKSLSEKETPPHNPANAEEEKSAGDEPIIRQVNKILLDGVRRGASDIHFEPYEHHFRIRLRQDGVLREIASLPAASHARIAARLKVMSQLDLAERRLPQDGHIKLDTPDRHRADFRISTCPTQHGEKLVLRILDSSSARMTIDMLGYDTRQRAVVETCVRRPYGMVLVTGPTGSGKTVSLYSALDLLNTEDRNISTAEDPVEINLPGINQVNVAPRIGLTFANCLRAFLRQDPDVIMVGEIRDLETAEIAIKAAQTGHMVLSTLHTNDAPKTLARLVNMGVPAYNIAASVSLVIAQRLARRLCPHCKIQADIPRQALIERGFMPAELEQLKLFEAHPEGCAQCNRGYQGRVGIFQVMPVSAAIGQIIMAGGNVHDIERQANTDGVLTLYQAGLQKVRDGIISLTELSRVVVR